MQKGPFVSLINTPRCLRQNESHLNLKNSNIKPQSFKLHPSEPVRTSKQALRTFVGCIWVWQVEHGWRDERCFSSAHFLHKCYATHSAAIIIKPPPLPPVSHMASACVTSLPFLENGSELFELHFCFKNLKFHYMNLWTYDNSSSCNLLMCKWYKDM